MTRTRKELITEKYISLKIQLEEYIDDSLFPSIEDIDISDIIFYLNVYFPKNGESEYITTIENLLKPIQINDNDISTVTNLIIDFISFLNNI
jgi:hypothetical protein